ncbi:MAG: GNAT family N-acetyltransferase [Candidatus Methanoperedens sp.]
MPLNGFEKHLLSIEYSDAIKDFNCCVSKNDNFEKLNIFLKEEGIKYNQDNYSKTNIYVKNGICVAYYSLAMASVEKPKVNKKKIRNMEEEYTKPIRDIPAIFLTRFAVDKNNQNSGLGRAILNNIIKKAYENEEIAARFIFLVAYPESISWYLRNPMFKIIYTHLNDTIEDYCEKKIIEKLNARLRQGHVLECELGEDTDISTHKKNCEIILNKHINDIFSELAPENSLLKTCHSKIKLDFEDNKPKIKLVGFNNTQNEDIIHNWLKNKENIVNLDITIPLFADINKLYKALELLN